MTRSARFALVVSAAAVLAACGQLGGNRDADRLLASTRVTTAPDGKVGDDGAGAGPLPQWNYRGDSGADNWGSMTQAWSACANGREQSPIDLTAASRFRPAAPGATPAAGAPGEQRIELQYHPSAYTSSAVGGGLQLQLADAGAMVIDDVPFALQEVRFHTPSEHTLGGTRYLGEYQLVHRSETGEVAVLAVLAQNGAENAALGPVLHALPADGQTLAGPAPLDPAALVPDNWTMARYNGSLSVPPCTEQVRWHVMLTPEQLSAGQISALSDRFPNSARPIQATNGRTVVAEIDTQTGAVKP